MCARRHSDDDREQSRGLADQLARLDTERDWMRTRPPAGDPASEHVDPPESTPAHYSPRLPAPPPVADSWDVVLSSGPQPSRSADPWTTPPAAAPDDPEQELWTPPEDTVYRPTDTPPSGDTSLPERWPPARSGWPDGPGEPVSAERNPGGAGGDPRDWTPAATTDESADWLLGAGGETDGSTAGSTPADDSALGGDSGVPGRHDPEGWPWGSEPPSGAVVTGRPGGPEREPGAAGVGGWSSSDTGPMSWAAPPASEGPDPVGRPAEDDAEPGSGLLSDTDDNDWPAAESPSWSGTASGSDRPAAGSEPWSGDDSRSDPRQAVGREASAGSSRGEGPEPGGWSQSSTPGEVSPLGDAPATPAEPRLGARRSPDGRNTSDAVETGSGASWPAPDHSTPAQPAAQAQDLSDDEWLAHLRGAGPDEEEARPEWAWQRFGGRRDAGSSWSAPDEPAVEPAPAEQPASLPPPSVSPQWTMGSASGAHPVAARSADQPPPADQPEPAGHRFGPVLNAAAAGITDLPSAPAGQRGRSDLPRRDRPVATVRSDADGGLPPGRTGPPGGGLPAVPPGLPTRRPGSSAAGTGLSPRRGPSAPDSGSWPATAGLDSTTEPLPPPPIPLAGSDASAREGAEAGWRIGDQAPPVSSRPDGDGGGRDLASGGRAAADRGASGSEGQATAAFPLGTAGFDARDEAYGDRSYGQQVILGGYGDRSTGALPAVGDGVRMPGERAGVADANDVTREWVAPSEDDPTPVEPGPGQFSLPLPEQSAEPGHGTFVEDVAPGRSSADADPADGTEAAPGSGGEEVDPGSEPAAGPEEFGGAHGAGAAPADDALYGPPAGPGTYGGAAAGYGGASYGFAAPGQRGPGSQAVPQGGSGVQGQYGTPRLRSAGPQGPPPGVEGPPPGMYGVGRQPPEPRALVRRELVRKEPVPKAGLPERAPAWCRPAWCGCAGCRSEGAGPQGPVRRVRVGPHGAGPRGGGPEGGGSLGSGPQGVPPTVEELTAQSLLRQRRPTPQTGWRRAVYNLSAHTVNPGQSNEDRRRQELIARASVPVPGCYRIAVISLKGGVGKTTTTVTLGATLASLRGDRVIAVDANPDRGTLSGKIPLETVATVRNLLNDVDSIQHYFDVRRYTSQSADRLEVLASESDPAVSTAFSEADYRTVAAVLERFYNIVLTDCGTGLLHSAMAGVLDLADQIVLVSSGSVDGARSASATLDWLEAHGRGELVRNSVAVINSVRPKSGRRRPGPARGPLRRALPGGDPHPVRPAPGGGRRGRPRRAVRARPARPCWSWPPASPTRSPATGARTSEPGPRTDARAGRGERRQTSRPSYVMVGRTSTSPYGASGIRAAISSARSIPAHSSRKTPARCSLTSANGPSPGKGRRVLRRIREGLGHDQLTEPRPGPRPAPRRP